MNNKYAGMTVNERLFVAGYLNDFDIALEQRDYAKAASMLRAVELPDSEILSILEKLGLKDIKTE